MHTTLRLIRTVSEKNIVQIWQQMHKGCIGDAVLVSLMGALSNIFCLIFFMMISFEVTFFYFALDYYVFHSIRILNRDLFCCCVIRSFDCKVKF